MAFFKAIDEFIPDIPLITGRLELIERFVLLLRPSF
jgi:hypothetical protein